MYLKLKADLGIVSIAFLMIMLLFIQIVFIIAIVFISGVVGKVMNISEWYSLGVTLSIMVPINLLSLFVYTVKFVIESIFIVPANEYEKNQILKEEEKNK